jgi:hypothetical protein
MTYSPHNAVAELLDSTGALKASLGRVPLDTLRLALSQLIDGLERLSEIGIWIGQANNWRGKPSSRQAWETTMHGHGGILNSTPLQDFTGGAADGIGNGDDAGSVFMRQVVDAAAVYERNLIKARTKAALAAKRKAGQLAGEVPFGWTADAAGNLIEVAEEQIVLGRIMACRAAGISLRKIAAILTEAGIVTKKGGVVWSHTSIKSIIERHAAVAA